jgi:hypothetical protein
MNHEPETMKVTPEHGPSDMNHEGSRTECLRMPNREENTLNREPGGAPTKTRISKTMFEMNKNYRMAHIAREECTCKVAWTDIVVESHGKRFITNQTSSFYNPP